MGVFDFLKSTPKRFVTEESFRSNTQKQQASTPKTLGELRKHGVNETDRRKLEFFFYTDTSEKAKELAVELHGKDYSVNYNKSSYDKKHLS